MSDLASFIIMAAGSGSRLGGTPKQFRDLGGMPMWFWSARTADHLFKRGAVGEIVLVIPAGCENEIARWADQLCAPVKIVRGGSVRAESVDNGVRESRSDHLMIHDAARPFIDIDLCERLIAAAFEVGASVPILPSVDSLRAISDGISTPADRNKIFRKQTPQCFNKKKLVDLLSASSTDRTDEISLFEEAGLPVEYVIGSESAFKITTDFDWRTALGLVAASSETRVGYGWDVHELVPGRRLVLGGVEIESPLGLLGHSDADLICHAVSDALLGAAGLGDIGTLFPASDERFKNADSTKLMEESAALVAADGWRIVWIDATLIAQIPRLGDLIPMMRTSLSRHFTKFAAEDKLNLKVKSGEHVGSVGRGECMICSVAVTIERCRI